MMKVDHVYFQLIWCRCTCVNLEEGPLKEFVADVVQSFSSLTMPDESHKSYTTVKCFFRDLWTTLTQP